MDTPTREHFQFEWVHRADSGVVSHLHNSASVVGLILHFSNARRPSSDRSFWDGEVVLNRKPFHNDRERMRIVVETGLESGVAW